MHIMSDREALPEPRCAMLDMISDLQQKTIP